MGKKILLIIISIAIILLLRDISASSLNQKVTAKVVISILNVSSPIENIVYQTNNIPVILNVKTSQKIKNIWIIDNNKLKPLCSKCNDLSKIMSFTEGQHQIKIRVDFENKDTLEKTINFLVDSISDIYIINNQGILKKPTSNEMYDYLFNFDFNITYKTDYVLDDSCSIRAKGGQAIINKKDFGSNNKLNFYVVSRIEQGQIELTAQKDRSFVSYKFKLNKIIESTKDLLKIEIQETKTKEIAILELDKVKNKTRILSNNISLNAMDVYFMNGCHLGKRTYYLLEKGSRITRSIETIRNILIQNPIFLKKYDNLKILFSPYWRILYYLS